MSDLPDLPETLSSLSSSLSALETTLAPLLAVPYLEQHETAELENPLQSAKLDVVVSYLVHDLIRVYLKLKGVETDSHPVTQELERLKTYFSKLRSADSTFASLDSDPKPDKRTAYFLSRPQSVVTDQTKFMWETARFTIDKAAASRFIQAAINSGAAASTSSGNGNGNGGASGSGKAHGKGAAKHTRFDQAVEGEVDRLLKDEEEEGDEEKREKDVLMVERVEPTPEEKSEGGELDGQEEDEDDPEDEDDDSLMIVEESSKKDVATGKKSQRPKMDPFTGYDQPKRLKQKNTASKKPQPPKKGDLRADGELSKKQKKKMAFNKAKEAKGTVAST